MNLSKFVNKPFQDDAFFDFKKFAQSIKIGVRFLDNVLDATEYPLEKIEVFSKKWRRIGLGFTALATAMAMLKIRYGSSQSMEFADRVSKTLRDMSYLESSVIAEEKGSFPSININKLMRANFIKTLPPEIRRSIRNKGLRNIQLNAIAPTGTISLSVGNNCSSGIEPVFAIRYDRNIRTGVKEKTKKETVYDYGYLKYREYTNNEDIPSYMVTTKDISPEQSIDLQAIVQKSIDHSISKTLNLPPGIKYEQYKGLYEYAYSKGLKGFTTFNPEGSMKGILEYSQDEKKDFIDRMDAPKRPKKLPCEIYPVSYMGGNYIIIIGFLNGSLYEIFWTRQNKSIYDILWNPQKGEFIKKSINGFVEKVKRGKYNLLIDGKILFGNFTNNENINSALARFISMSLRHGTPLQYIVDQLQKDNKFIDFERYVSRILKKYIKNGEEVLLGDSICSQCGEKLIFVEGCVTCSSCGDSKCL